MRQNHTFKSEKCGLFCTDFEEEIGEALITTKALLKYRHGEACGLLESIFQLVVNIELYKRVFLSAWLLLHSAVERSRS